MATTTPSTSSGFWNGLGGMLNTFGQSFASSGGYAAGNALNGVINPQPSQYIQPAATTSGSTFSTTTITTGTLLFVAAAALGVYLLVKK